MTKVTTSVVKKIRELRALGYLLKDIALIVQVSHSTVESIKVMKMLKSKL